MNFNQPSILMIVSSIISLYLSVYAWKKRQTNSGYSLSLLLLGITIWSLFYGLEVASNNFVMMKVFLAFQYLGIATIPVLWFIFTARYSGNTKWLTPRNSALLFIVPLITIVASATNQYHNLYYAHVEFVSLDGYNFQKLHPGTLYWLHIVYSYSIIIVGLTFLFKMIYGVARTQRKNIRFFLIAILLPYIVNILYVLGLKPYGFLDLTPVAFIPMGVILAFGVFTIQLFDITPLVLEILFNSIPDAIFVTDTNKRIINVNPEAVSLLKSFNNDVNHLDISKAFLLEDFFSDKEEITDISQNGKWYHKSNTVITDSLGHYLGTLTKLHDISKRKYAEEQLKKNEQHLSELNKAKDKFFSIIAHDLRSPFTSIIGFSQLLVEEIKSNDFNKVEEFADIILKSSQKALNLLTNLMTWARSQTGKLEFKPQPLNLSEIIDDIIILFRETALQKSITISGTFPESLPVVADQEMISTVLRNLVSNAVKFTRIGGKILISANIQDNVAHVSVKDNGIGMDKDLMQNLFRLDKNTGRPGTNDEESTGLGLVLCKEFIEKHNGSITVESDINNGTVFHICLPLNN